MDRALDTGPATVRALLREQTPAWADDPLRSLAVTGTDHALYLLGTDRLVRLPRVERAVPQVLREQQWLPRIAPRLPLPVPEGLHTGRPAPVFPYPWSVVRWLEGEAADADRLGASDAAAETLGAFVNALRTLDGRDGPGAGPENFGRGVPLARRDAALRSALDALGDRIDRMLAEACWQDALDAPTYEGPPVWFHGDLHAGNLLVRDGALAAVIDFGGMGTGDPAVDLLPAWTLFDAERRARFRDVLDADEASWRRGRGWAVSMAVIALPYHWDRDAGMVRLARRMLAALGIPSRGPAPVPADR